MPEEPFRNREIIEMFSDVKQGLVDIKEQTTKTNGRVSALEKWKFVGMGATSVLSFLVVPILVWALSILVNMDQRIQQSVDRALQAYDITK